MSVMQNLISAVKENCTEWNTSNQTQQKSEKNKTIINCGLFVPSTCLATIFSSPLRLYITRREDLYKYLMTLDATNALKNCCTFNFLPLCFFLCEHSTSTNVSQRVLKELRKS